MMNIVYLHGFQSNSNSVKGQILRRHCADLNGVHVHLPDLNMPPLQVMQQMSELIEGLDNVVLVGSSLGGFYATQLMARHHIPAVLINPAVYPWQLFRDLFGETALPYQLTETWCLDDAQLNQMQALAVSKVENADQLLVLLQQGDETLDYRDAADFYSAAQAGMAMLITEVGGTHGMDDFAEKIPMLLQFLSDAVKNMPK